MLTILNHHLLANKPVGKEGWVVVYCSEHGDYYEINLNQNNVVSKPFGDVKIRLQRTKTKVGGKSVYRFRTKWRTNPQSSVTIDYLKDMNNLLKSLENLISYYANNT